MPYTRWRSSDGMWGCLGESSKRFAVKNAKQYGGFKCEIFIQQRLWLSLLIAVAASAAALALVFSVDANAAAPRNRIVIGGFLAGLGAAGMHYLGMFAWQTQVRIQWNVPLVVASV